MQETPVQSLGREDPLKQGMATHSFYCLENSTDRDTLWTTVQGVHKESDVTEHKAHTTVINKLKIFPLLLVFRKVTGSIFFILLVEFMRLFKTYYWISLKPAMILE